MGLKRWVVALEVMACLVLTMARWSAELSSSHPQHGLVDRVNWIGGPYAGLVMAFSTEQEVLQASVLFLPNKYIPWVDLSGRRFHIGKIRGIDVIYIMTGQRVLNAGITVQILLDAFDILGVVHYGIAGSANDSLTIGDVGVLNYVAFTSTWKWKTFQSEKGDMPELKFGTYNFPNEGENLLANIEFTSQELYSTGHPMQKLFWLPINPKSLSVASQLEDLKLQQCVNETYCLQKTPRVVYGLRGSTADIFLSNAAYRSFLFNEFNVSTVDEESSAIVMTCLTNGVPCIVFRGISDSAGARGELASEDVFSLVATNAMTVAVGFIGLIGNAEKIAMAGVTQ